MYEIWILKQEVGAYILLWQSNQFGMQVNGKMYDTEPRKGHTKYRFNKVKIKVSHSLIAVGAVGLETRAPIRWKAETIRLRLRPYPSLIRKNVPIYCQVEFSSRRMLKAGLDLTTYRLTELL